MSPSLRVAAVLTAAGALEFAPALVQQVKTYTKPDVEYAEPFTILNQVRELGDGRLIAVDPREKTVQLIDLKTGTATKIGREGSGPGEYGLPSRVLALSGDSSVVVDMIGNRLLVIQPDGKPGGFLEPRTTTTSRGGMMTLGNLPTQTDGRGGLYYSGSPVVMGDKGPVSADSVPIMRWRPTVKKVDTLAWLALPKNAAQVSGGRGNMNVRIGGGNPFTAQDAFAVAPDGRVAILHAADYRVDWVSPSGQRTAGAPIAYEHIKVSEGHKAEWRERRKNQFGVAVTMENGRRSAQMVPVGRDAPEPTDWPEYMPPFLQDPGLVAPNGQLWIARTGKPNDPPAYDVIDAAGKLVEKVVVPRKTRVIGFGRGVVYMTRRDDDDLLYLQRYRLQ